MSDNRKDVRSQALDLLRFPLACVVVTIHVFVGASFVVQGVSYDFTEFWLSRELIVFAQSFLAGQSVPIYFFIAGYVFFLGINLDMSTYSRKMRNRFKSLFIPYISWNLLASLMALLPFLPVLSGFFPGLVGKSPDFHLANILNMFWDESHGILPWNEEAIKAREGHGIIPVDGPLWFVRDLMIVGVTSPLINILLKRGGKLLPVISGIAWFCLPEASLGHGYQLITAYFFFSLGAYLSFHKRDMVTEFKRMRMSSFVAYPLVATFLFGYIYFGHREEDLMEFGFTGWLIYVKNLAVLAGLPFAYNLAVLMIERWQVHSSHILSSAAFFIYAGHWLFFQNIEKVLMIIIKPMSNLSVGAVLFLTVLATVLGLLGLYMAMRRFTPRLLGFFTGGRL